MTETDRPAAPDRPRPIRAGVLVCVDAGPLGPLLIRHAEREAERRGAPWTALHIETTGIAGRSEAAKDRVAATLRFAEQLGGEAVVLPGARVAREILRYASANGCAVIILGKPARSRWWRPWRRPITERLIRASGEITIQVASGESDARPLRYRVETAPDRRLRSRPYLTSLGYLVAATLVGVFLSRTLAVQNIALVFLMAVLGSAVGGGLAPALLTSAIAALLYNFFFLPPLYTLDLGSSESVIAFLFFLGTAIIASNLAGRVQRQAEAARARARTTDGLYRFSRKLSGTGTLDEVLWATAYQVASMLNVHVVILLPAGDRLAVGAGYPPDDTLADADIAAAHWAWEHDRPAGRGADTLPGARRLYLPLRTGRAALGAVGLDSDAPGPLLTAEGRRLYDALADQAALAIERIQLVAAVDEAKLAAETDKLRSALLRSISHDLKTPLSAILGTAGALRDYSATMPEADRADLLATMVDEAERLNRFIANLLDMTRLESGAVEPNASLLFLADVVETTLRRARKILARHQVEVSLPPDLPMLSLDHVLIEQVLFNLIDNATKYAPPGSTLRLRGWVDGETARLEVMDEGPGIPEDSLERIFNSFYRVGKTDTVRAGTGLGLSICRGFVEAMGGAITARNRADRSGAIFTMGFPIPSDRPRMDGLP